MQRSMLRATGAYNQEQHNLVEKIK